MDELSHYNFTMETLLTKTYKEIDILVDAAKKIKERKAKAGIPTDANSQILASLFGGGVPSSKSSGRKKK